MRLDALLTQGLESIEIKTISKGDEFSNKCFLMHEKISNF